MIPKRLKAVGCVLAIAMTVIAAAWPSPAVAAASPNDPLFRQQWGLRRIGIQSAWKVTQGAGTTIAIVDTGVDRRHEDLSPNFLRAKQYDAINDDNDAADLCPEAKCHGTSVAGVAAAAANNKKGIAGAAPKAKIMAVRAFGALAGAASADVADGIMWATDNGADVINLSLGKAVPIDPDIAGLVEVAVIYAMLNGSLVVVAAGNEGDPFCSTPAFNPAVMCVGASDEFDRVAIFGPEKASNYGLRMDVMAPGKGIITTDRGFYTSTQGTSVAAPYVAGVGALLMSMGATNLQAASIIRATAKDLGLPGYDITYGFGRLDAKAAVEMCQQVC